MTHHPSPTNLSPGTLHLHLPTTIRHTHIHTLHTPEHTLPYLPQCHTPTHLHITRLPHARALPRLRGYTHTRLVWFCSAGRLMRMAYMFFLLPYYARIRYLLRRSDAELRLPSWFLPAFSSSARDIPLTTYLPCLPHYTRAGRHSPPAYRASFCAGAPHQYQHRLPAARAALTLCVDAFPRSHYTAY